MRPLRCWLSLALILMVLAAGCTLAVVRFEPTYLGAIPLGDRHIDYGNLLFSPDGTLIAYSLRRASSGVVHVWTLQPSLRERFTVPVDSFVSRLEFLPEGSRLAVLDAEGSVFLVNAATGERGITFDNGGTPIWDMSAAPEGGTIATLDESGSVAVWNADTGERVQSIGEVASGEHVRFTPDGRRLVVSTSERRLYVWGLDGGESAYSGQDLRDLILFTPDSRYALTYVSGHTRLWDLDSGAIAGRVDYMGFYAATVTPEGDVLLAGKATAENQVHIMDVRASQQRYTVGAAWALFSPDGRWLATASGAQYRDGIYWAGGGIYFEAPEVWLWDVATRRRWLIYHGDKHIERLWFSPDGTRLAFMDVSAVVHVLDLA